MKLDINCTARVWREGCEWWAQRFELGRCIWLAGPFKSSRKAQIACEMRSPE